MWLFLYLLLNTLITKDWRFKPIQLQLNLKKNSLHLLFLILQIFQGLLCVFYNLGDGEYNLTLPNYRLDNGEWHEVLFDRHDNEMMLRLDGGGGQREVTGSRGRSREIIIDPSAVMLGNTFSSGINKSFQGWCQLSVAPIKIFKCTTVEILELS